MNLEHKEGPPKRVNKIHFLIHPGFLEDYGSDASEQRKTQQVAQYGHLMERYEKAFVSLPEDELLVLFTHVPAKTFRKSLIDEERFAKKTKQIARVLGRQAIVLSKNVSLFETTEAMDTIRRIALARGYMFDAETLTYAYGEILQACVTQGAENLNKTGGFKTPTALETALTNGVDLDPAELRKIIYGIQTYHPRLHIEEQDGEERAA